MKLAEAILERQQLENKVKRLRARIINDHDEGRPTKHIQEELSRTVNQARDMSIAVDWTEQTSSMSGIPLGAYRTRIKYLIQNAEFLEKINHEQADVYWESANHDIKIVEAATWLLDLKIPGTSKEEES